MIAAVNQKFRLTKISADTFFKKNKIRIAGY